MTNKIDENKLTDSLSEMLNYIKHDPNNLSLLSDTAEMALSEGQVEITKSLLNSYANLSPLSEKELNLKGLLAIKSGSFDEACQIFSKLHDDGNKGPSVNFNLAWSYAMLKDFENSLKFLTVETTNTLPQAAMLELQILHEQGKFDEAAKKAYKYSEDNIEHEGLNAAISVLALDITDIPLARATALKSGAHPDGLTTLGTLALRDDDHKTALEYFERALSLNTHAPRSWLGKGLAQLSQGNAQEAVKNINRGADIFQTHIGSWIAAGWAHFIIHDLEGARTRFEKALALDENFAESHGSLAVLDIILGNIDEGKTRTKKAQRLDPNCFSASLAQVLRLSSNGNSEVAKMIFDKAVNTPIDGTGLTLAKSMAKLGLS